MRECTVPTDRHFGYEDILPVFARHCAATLPRTIPFERFEDGRWSPITMAAFVYRAEELAAGLIASEVKPGDRVALMSATRYEWVLLDMAIWMVGGITVPVYPSSAPSQLEWIVRDSGAGILIAETAEHATTVRHASLPSTCAEVLYIDDGDLDLLRDRGSQVEASQVDDALATLTLQTPASIIYTSGTTGEPKGCVITHENLLYECHSLLDHPIGVSGKKGKKTLMFLPLAHVLPRSVTYCCFIGGATTGFWSNPATIAAGLEGFRPHMIVGVPRVFEKIRDGIAAHARSQGWLQERIFRHAEAAAIERSRAIGGDGLGDRRDEPLVIEARHRIFDTLIYRAVRKVLGGQCDFVISGGGALPDDVAHFFRGLNVPLFEGYGLTETTAAVTVNGPSCHRVGTVGQPIKGVSIRIEDDGEILIKGPMVSDRYWGTPEGSEDAFDGPWLRTGDLGKLDKDGFLTITGRKKEILVTAGGKNVIPGPMEERLRAHRLIDEAVVIGERHRFVSALLSLDLRALQNWAQENGKAGIDPELLISDSALLAEVQTAVDSANRVVSHTEGIKKFALLPREFTETTGELTATQKVRRHIVEQRYAQQIEELYR